jgi:hypothetical protein
MEPEIIAALGRLVNDAPEIIEAHLPQVFVSGVQAPAQVLVIVTVDGTCGGARQGRRGPRADPAFRPQPDAGSDGQAASYGSGAGWVGQRRQPTGILRRLRRR